MKIGIGKQALITGASSGIGEAYARKLASLGYDLILVARRKDLLEAIAKDLKDKFSVSVCVMPCDLAKADDMTVIEDKIRQTDNLSVLVNNAGFGFPGAFAECDEGKSLDMIAVHITAPTRLTKAALPGMITRKEGYIINVASMAAFLPSAGSVMYGATKTYLVSFSECLQIELQNSGVNVQALCPGFTRTGFHSTEELSNIDFSYLPPFLWTSADKLVEQSWRAAGKKQTVFIPGTIYRIAYLFRGLIAYIAKIRPSTTLTKSAETKKRDIGKNGH
ncbi:MAG: SDR family oxidoreductase [Dehalococcoidia bacterium]|nr:MAG: SDR family oxidoreductase [Dehalococcoidia bacterium]